MKYLQTLDIPLAEIELGERLRAVDPVGVERLKLSLADAGQITPITVVGQLRGPKYRLVAGAHRVEAARALGWSSIRAEVMAPQAPARAELESTLHQIDENAGRYELNALDRARFVGRRLELYRQLYPKRFRRGGDRRSKGFSNPKVSGLKFVRETGALLDCSDDVVERSLRIYRMVSALPPALQARLDGSTLAKSEGALYTLTRQAPGMHAAIIGGLLDGRYERVEQATAALAGEPAEKEEPADQAERMLDHWWRRATPEGRRRFLQWLMTFDEAQC